MPHKSLWPLPEPEITVGHQKFSDHFQQMSEQLSFCSDIMPDHSKSHIDIRNTLEIISNKFKL